MNKACCLFMMRIQRFALDPVRIGHFGLWLAREPLSFERGEPAQLDDERAEGIMVARLELTERIGRHYGWIVGMITRIALTATTLRLSLTDSIGASQLDIPLSALRAMYIEPNRSLVIRDGRLTKVKLIADQEDTPHATQDLTTGDTASPPCPSQSEPDSRGMEY